MATTNALQLKNNWIAMTFHGTFKHNFLNENVRISIQISLIFVL